MDFLRFYQHLLPTGRAWRTTTDKRLRQLFAGLATLPDGIRDAADAVWSDVLPATTSKLREWEQQLGLPANITDEAERRVRLAGAWRALIGGQSPSYIQGVLQASGFDVYVHEWWDPATGPTPGTAGNPTVRNPQLVLRKRQTQTAFQVTCGNPAATCGNPAATCGSTLEPIGYPLVNIIGVTRPLYTTTAGNPAATCGNPAATAGAFASYTQTQREYIVPSDPARWPYFLYIGGQTFGSVATVAQDRRDEFEALCLKVSPLQQWLGIIVKYV
jgi:hypothetical protein